MIKRILVAGIGNIFLGDDAFGVRVVEQLARHTDLPQAVDVREFGIRSYDLAYAMASGYETVVLVDACPRGGAPGSLYLIEPEQAPAAGPEVANAHTLNPARILQIARSFGERIGRVLLLGCEPTIPGSGAQLFELSGEVRAAVPQAVMLITSLVKALLAGNAFNPDEVGTNLRVENPRLEQNRGSLSETVG